MVTDVVPSPPRFLPSFFIAHRVQQSHCPSIFRRLLLTHALALSASRIVHKKKSPRIFTSMHSAGLELTKLTYTRLEGNLIRHRGDRCDSTIVYDTESSAERTLPSIAITALAQSVFLVLTGCPGVPFVARATRLMWFHPC